MTLGEPVNDGEHCFPSRARSRPPIPIPQTLEEMMRLAEVVVNSHLALGHRTKESVVIALQLGAELGFTPMQSLRMIAVIKGRPVPSADGCVAAVTASGQCEYFREIETTDTHSTWETQRRGDAQPRRFTFTIDDARRAGLIHREHWQAYPKRMLAARAKKYLAQDTYPDIIGGLLSAEEALDLPGDLTSAGNSGETPTAVERPATIGAEQIAVLERLIAEAGLDMDTCIAWLRGRRPDLESLSDLPTPEYARVKRAIEDQIAKRQTAPKGTDHAAAD